MILCELAVTTAQVGQWIFDGRLYGQNPADENRMCSLGDSVRDLAAERVRAFENNPAISFLAICNSFEPVTDHRIVMTGKPLGNMMVTGGQDIQAE